MSLPASLRTSITPPELELVATQQLVEIIPLVAMEKTVFISVRNQTLNRRIPQTNIDLAASYTFHSINFDDLKPILSLINRR
jgi:hypothetical protein